MSTTPYRELLCGDCRHLLKSLPSDFISACITDPPYNYEFIGRDWNHTEIQRRLTSVQNSSTLVRNIPYGSGLAGGVRDKRWYQRIRDNIEQYETWCSEWGEEVFRVCKPGAFAAIFSSTRSVAHVQTALEKSGFYARDILVYRRSSGIPKGLNLSSQLKRKGRADYDNWKSWHSALRGEWEAIVLLQKPLTNNYMQTFESYGVGLMRTINEDGTFQSNILEGFAERKSKRYNVHCTVKPLALIEKVVNLLVPDGVEHIVLDPFAGSGTTLAAASRLGHGYVGIEIVPDYIEVIESRLALKTPNLGNQTLPLFE